MPDFSKIPQTLKDCACWLVAKLVPQPTADNPGKIAKLPWDFAKDCKASGWQLQENLLPFPDAVALLESHAGPYVLGFAFKHSPFLGIDIDKAFDDRSLKKALEPVYREFCSGFYHEWSPSGRGIRAFVRRDGALPDWVNENRDAFSLYGGCQVEVFAGGFCTVTGKAFPNATDKVKVAAPLDVYGFCKSRAEADSLADEKGGRNSGVMSWAGLQAKKLAGKVTWESFKDLVHGYNGRQAVPLSEDEIEGTVLKSLRKVFDGSKPERKLFLKIRPSLAELPDEHFTWLWHNIILSGVVNLFVGNPDAGKTLVAIKIISLLTTGRCFPFSTRRVRPRKVVIVCREDSYSRMWKPRLLAAGADLRMVIPVEGMGVEGSDETVPWYLDEQAHLDELKALLVSDTEIALAVVDPLADLLSHSDLNKQQDVRSVTGALNKVVQDTNVAMIAISHTTKALVDSVIKVAAGSFQLMAAMQMAYWFTEDPDKKDGRLMLCARNKSGKKRGFEYVIKSVSWPDGCLREALEDGEEDDGAPLVEFKSTTDVSATELLQKAQEQGESKAARCRKWLNEWLKDGEKDSKLCNEVAEAMGFDKQTVDRACGSIGVDRKAVRTWKLKKEPVKETQEEVQF
ncbi:MAG TPA: AAA family ATPase [Terriglobales bacterium]|nr:AAA family ATPase [Terriglobales bacterium]